MNEYLWRNNQPPKFTLHPGDLWVGVAANAVKAINSLDKTKAWDIEIRPHEKKRTEKQRKSLFGAAYKKLMEEIGLRGAREKEQLHEYFCIAYFGAHETLPNKPKRTTTKNEHGEHDEITTKEALDFYAFIQQHAAEEMEIDVPDPDPLWRNAA